MDVLADGAWEKIFKVKPEVFTAEEKRAWLDQMTDVALGSDAFFPFSDNIERAKKSGVKSVSYTHLIKDNYDLVYGTWPKSYNEIVLVLDQKNEIATPTLYELGILPSAEYKKMMDQINRGEEVENEQHKWSYEELCTKKFYLIPACDYYEKQENGIFKDFSTDTNKIETLLDNGIELKVSGVVRLNEDANTMFLTQPIGYTKALTDYLIEYANNSEIVKAQKAEPVSYTHLVL